jgi:hypothetical protein
MMHRQDPLDRKKPPLRVQFRYTITILIAFALVSAILFTEFGKKAWVYVAVCTISVIFVFAGEVLRR